MELTNHFLIAMPSRGHSIFSGSVVYITDHKVQTGAVGVVINKVISRTLDDVFRNLDIFKYEDEWKNNHLYWGGPVGANKGYFLHKTDDKDSNYRLISDKDFLKKSPNKDQNFFMSMGYSQWAPLQLEIEVRQNFWIVVGSEPSLIFNTDPTIRYQEALKIAGINNLSKLYYHNDIIGIT